MRNVERCRYGRRSFSAKNVGVLLLFLCIIGALLFEMRKNEIIKSDPEITADYYTVEGVGKVNSEYVGKDRAHRYYRIDIEADNGEIYSFMDSALKMESDTRLENAEKQAEVINNIYKSNDEVNFYLYIAKRMQDTVFYEKFLPQEKSSKAQFDVFIQNLDSGIKCGVFSFSSVYERLENVFKTDHHWNAAGAYKGYCDIVNMMRKDSPELEEPIDVTYLIKPLDGKFYGSFCRKSKYDKLWDELTVYDYRLPEHRTYPDLSFEDRIMQVSTEAKSDLNSNVYSDMYPNIKYVHYPENETGRRLLVLCDSYVRPLTETLAYHFDRTYYLYYYNYPELDYNGFIEEYGITDVLILQFSERVVFNIADDCNLDKLILE